MSRIHDKTTATHIAACAALGLHYWSKHPLPGRVWAVDDNQQPHVVRVYAKAMTAAVQKWVPGLRTTGYTRAEGYKFSDDWDNSRSYDAGPVIGFEVSDSTQLTFAA